jgi:hypothetical protein
VADLPRGRFPPPPLPRERDSNPIPLPKSRPPDPSWLEVPVPTHAALEAQRKRENVRLMVLAALIGSAVLAWVAYAAGVLL